MAEPSPVSLRELTAVLLSAEDVETALREIIEITARTLPVEAGGAIILERGGRVTTVASTSALVRGLDEAQHANGDGPCLTALRTGREVAVPDLRTERRWGGYPAQVLSHGLASMLSLPLTAGGRTIGALNLYSTRPFGFPREVHREAATIARHTEVLLGVLLRQADQARLTSQLREALASRTVIDQALGIVMAERRCDADTAFGVLRTASQDHNIKVCDVAGKIVESVGGASPAPGPFSDPRT